jgi:uncharacterized membrane protein
MKKVFLILTALIILTLDFAVILQILSSIESGYVAEIVMLGLSVPILYALSIMWRKPSENHL